jgi:Ca2+-transporting ATPase
MEPRTTGTPIDTPIDLSISWHALSAEEVINKLGTVPHTGLTTEEAKKRMERYGPNQLTEKPRPTFFQLLIGQLNNFIVIMLIVAAVISAILGDSVEAIAIASIVVLNAILGVVQESRAEEALAKLCVTDGGLLFPLVSSYQAILFFWRRVTLSRQMFACLKLSISRSMKLP